MGVSITGFSLFTPSLGTITYSYNVNKAPKFNTIYEVDTVECPGH
jgi:hypothetical protein